MWPRARHVVDVVPTTCDEDIGAFFEVPVKIPPPTHTTASAIDAWHEARPDLPRPHMGASTLGHACDRWLWLSFRWAVREKFSGRMLRLFRRGQNEEATIIADLQAIGCVISEPPPGEQHRVSLGGHVSGSLDAIIEHGLPEAPTKRHVCEFKTHSKKSFDALERDGVQKAKWQHFVQMQVYMHGTGIDRALYVAVCKDDDRLYTERVRYDEAIATKAIERGQRLAIVDEQPPPLSTDGTWYECRFCAAHPYCHQRNASVPKNCRTCRWSTALPNGTWRCEAHQAEPIPLEFQREGCGQYELHDDMREHCAP